MYIRPSDDVLDVFWTFYVHSIYIMCRGEKLTIDDHAQDICKKTNKKLKALTKATPYMKTENKKF